MKSTIARWVPLLGISMMILLLAGCNYPSTIDEKSSVTVNGALGLEGYPLITREKVGTIPAGTRVKVNGILAEGGRRLYRIVTQDETAAEAREDQLVVASDIVPAPTPTIAYFDALGRGGYPLVTLEQVNSIPAGTRVMTGGVWFDGINMIYQITTEDGLAAEAREYQLALAPGVTIGPTPTAVFEDLWNWAGYPLITLEQVGDIPAGTVVRGWRTYFDGTYSIYQVTAQNGTTAEAREDQLVMAPGYTPAPIPSAVFNTGFALITLEQVGNVPSGTIVRSGASWYDGSNIIYQIYSQDGMNAEAREDQLAYAPGVTPGPTPTAAFMSVFGSAGYPLTTLEQVGNIPAGTRVSIASLWFDGLQTVYQITDQNGNTAEARENQLATAPDYTPPGPTPIPAFSSFNGMGGYPLLTVEQIGNIPANTRVNVAGTWYDGTHIMYQIVARDGTTAEAREDQLTLGPGVTPGPTPADPLGYTGMGYVLLTTEQIGNIPAGARVMISSSSRDEIGWLYIIVAEDGLTTAEAREHQLTPAPYATPGPSPIPTQTTP